MISKLLLSVMLMIFVCGGAMAADWPQWRGPDRDGKSADTGLLQQWPEAGPALAWRIGKLGGGYSAPAVAAGRIYGMSHREGQPVAWALDEANGEEIWVKPVGPAYEQQMPQGQEGPGSTPAVDGDMIYVIDLRGDVVCMKASDGEIVWKKSMTADFGGEVPRWSYRESALIDGDKVICTPGGPGAAMVALNKTTGEVIWKTDVTNRPRAAYASAIIVEAAGHRQYVNFTHRALVGIDATDGKLLWEYTRPANGNGINCATPIADGATVYASSAYGTGVGGVTLSAGEVGGVAIEQKFFTRALENQHGGMLLVDGCLYGANGGNRGGNLVCLDAATGDVLWDLKGNAQYDVPKGSVAYADGRIYYYTEAGEVLLIEPSREAYLERGRFTQPDRTRQPAWTNPVIANGKLYLRDQDLLFCYDLKAE